MILLLLIYLGGVLTILSPCVLPVLPFIFARAEQPFIKSGLPMLAGMAITFTGIASLAAVGGAWAVHLNQYGRILALVLLTVFALTLLSRRLADMMAHPFVLLGNRLLQGKDGGGANNDKDFSIVRSAFLGVATGLLWAPCAGPILGLVLTGAAISGPNAHTTLLLFAYAAGAVTSLALALLAGGRVFAALKRSLGAGEWVRRGLGVLVLIAVVVIACGWDTAVLTKLSLNSTNSLETSLIQHIDPSRDPAAGNNGNAAGAVTAGGAAPAGGGSDQTSMRVEGNLPPLTGATGWLNSPPLTPESLRGKVVVIDFWTYSCINCLRSLPYVKAWYDKYKDHGLVVIGVHSPEFAFEKDPKNVEQATKDLGVSYPVALDDKYAIWQAFDNEYWPAHYFIDATGKIRGHHFGEGDYAGSEQIIRNLLTEAGYKDLPPAGDGTVKATGVEAAMDGSGQDISPETYIGFLRAENFVSKTPFKADSKSKAYALPADLKRDQWGLTGEWKVAQDMGTLTKASGTITYRFHARDLHLVLGPGADGKPVRFKVLLDGVAPGANHGVDIDADGNGVVKEQRLYQLIRQTKNEGDHTFSIEFLDKGVQAFAFTFG
jgi:cytochrome c biogenesis protein CcdA/thiol-disulfide isomerase/thioredoxin